MTHVSAHPTILSPVPGEIRDQLGAAPATNWEDRDGYERLLASAGSAAEPSDILEWLWVKDVADLVWEARRLRAAKAALVVLGRRQGARELNRKADPESPASLTMTWNEGLDRDLRGSRALLEDLGLGRVHVEGLGMSQNVRLFADLDRQIGALDARRAVALKEMERRRGEIARRLRVVADAFFASDQPVDQERSDDARRTA